MAEFETITVTRTGLRLDVVLAKRDRAYQPGLVEEALDLNPGLAALGTELPVRHYGSPANCKARRQGCLDVVRLSD